MTSATGLATSRPSWQGLGGQQVAVCTLIYFYVHEEPLNEAGPMLSRLLSHITRLIFQVNGSSINLLHFLQLLLTALKTGYTLRNDETQEEASVWISKIESIILESSTFPGLHSFFTKMERLLMTEELYDEIRNITIKPAERQIDEQSPFGQFLQRCLESYLSLEDEEFAILVREVQDWVTGRAAPRTNGADKEASTSALNRGDYSQARAQLEGFFDRSPFDSSNQSLQEALFLNSTFHYQTKAYESARASLDESLRLSRGVNDLECIAACDRLLQRIESEESSNRRQDLSKIPRGQPSFPLQDLWRVERELDKGRPLLSILKSLSSLLSQGKKIAPPSSKEFAECCLYQARTWNNLGVQVNSSALVQTSITEGSLIGFNVSRDLALPKVSLESECLVQSGKVTEALAALFHGQLLESLTISSFGDWQAKVWMVLYTATLQMESTETQQAIRAIRPEVVKEVEGSMDAVWQEQASLREENEATFGRSDKITLNQQLLGNLKEARIIREGGNNCAESLVMSTKVMRRAEESNLFRLYRMAILECSESLLTLGDTTKAKELLQDVMPQLLIERESILRARSSWLYARILLSLRERKEIDLGSVLPWLDRARNSFKETGSIGELSDVLYVQIKLLEHFGNDEEATNARIEYDKVQEEVNSSSPKKVDLLFDTVRSAVMLVGARIVAGG